MKQRIAAIALALALFAALCLPALTAEEYAGGFYNIGSAPGVTVTPKGGDMIQVNAYVEGRAGECYVFYSGSDRLTVTLDGADAAHEYVVTLTAGSAFSPESALYMDQGDGTTVFTVAPDADRLKALSGQELTLWIRSDAWDAPRQLSLRYTKGGSFETIPYARGDVNRKDGVTAEDAKLVLRAVAGLETLDRVQQTLADVDGEAGLTARDALWILQAAAGTRTLS